MSEFAAYYQDSITAITKDYIKQPFNIQHPSYGADRCQFSEDSVILKTPLPYDIVIDCSQFGSCSFKEKSLVTCLRDQYLNAAGIQFKSTSYPSKMYVIIGFDTESECNQALKKQFVLQDKIIQVSKIVPNLSHIVHTEVIKIPIPCTNEVQGRMIEYFSRYGEVLAIGKYISREGHWFSGCGYATLNVNKPKECMLLMNTNGEFICGPESTILSVKSPIVVETSCSLCLNVYYNEWGEYLIDRRPDYPQLCRH